MLRRNRQESGLDPREFIRGEERLGVIGGGGEAGEGPVQIGPGIDAEELAGAEDGVEDGGTVTGIWVADKEPIFQTKLTWTNLPLGRIIIDQEMTVARVGETGEFGPASQGVAEGLAQSALGQDGGVRGGGRHGLMEFDQNRDRAGGTNALARGGIGECQLRLDGVELAKADEERGGALVVSFEGLDETAACMGGAACAHDLVTGKALQGGVIGAPAVGLQNAGKAVEQFSGRPVTASQMKLKGDDLKLRRMDGPKPGVAGLARPFRIEERDGSLVHLQIPAARGAADQFGVNALEQEGALAHPLDHGLAGECRSQPAQHLLLSVEWEMIYKFGKEHMGDESGADLTAGNHTCGELSDARRAGVGRAGSRPPRSPPHGS